MPSSGRFPLILGFTASLGRFPLAWATLIVAIGCASVRRGPGAPEPAGPAAEAPAESPCGSYECEFSDALLATPQLQQAARDLQRLGLVTDIREPSPGRLELTVTRQALDHSTPLAYHLERLYRAYRVAYDLKDVAALDLKYEGRVAGQYTNQGLIWRERGVR